MSASDDLRFDTLIFDLDDTLTDTEGQLVSAAREESLRAMKQAGMSLSSEQASALWREYLIQPRHSDVFDFISQQSHGAEDKARVAMSGREVFYRRSVPESFHAFADAPAILSQLRTKYDLYLVTTGDVQTQKQKVKLTNLGSFFNSVFYVDHMNGETKRGAFQQVLLRHDGFPGRILVVGNRLDHEIREGKTLGFKTCYVKRGEHRHQEPLAAQDYPDFTIDHIRELISRCRL